MAQTVEEANHRMNINGFFNIDKENHFPQLAARLRNKQIRRKSFRFAVNITTDLKLNHKGRRFRITKLILFKCKSIQRKNRQVKKVRERKLERNFGDPAVGRRVSVRAAAGVLSSFRLNHQSLSPLLFLRFPSVGALVSHQPPWLWFWSHDAFVGRMGRLSCTFSVSGRRRLSQNRRRRSLHPWRGSFLSSAVVGSSPRGEGYHSFASPDLVP